MRDQYWNYYVNLGHQIEYIQAYKIRTGRFCLWLTGILIVASTAGVATLSIWAKYPAVWAGIVVVAQVLEALKPILPQTKQNKALEYILQDYRQIFQDTEYYWRQIENYSDPEISQLLYDFDKRKTESYERFASDIDFPVKKGCVKIAEEANKKYFWYHFNVSAEEDYH